MDPNQIFLAAIVGIIGTALGSIAGPWFQRTFQDARLHFAEQPTAQAFSVPLKGDVRIQTADGKHSYYRTHSKQVRVFNPGSLVIDGTQFEFSWEGGRVVDLVERRSKSVSWERVSFQTETVGEEDFVGDAPRRVRYVAASIEANQLLELTLTAAAASGIKVTITGTHYVRQDWDDCGRTALGNLWRSPRYSGIRWLLAGMALLLAWNYTRIEGPSSPEAISAEP